MLTYTKVENPQWADKEKTAINCKVYFDAFEGAPEFTAHANDVEEHGRQIYNDLIEGKFGVIQDYVNPNTLNDSPFPTAPSGSISLTIFE